MRTVIEIKRVYARRAEHVWRAWTEPAQLARWWGKRGWTAQLETIELDVRPGGTFRVTTVNDEDGSEMTNEGTYSEVDPPERLAFGETVVTFTELGDGRTEMSFRTTIEADDGSRARGRRTEERVRAPRRAPQGDHMSTTTTSSPASTTSASRATTSRRRASSTRTCWGSRPRASGSGRASPPSARSSRPAR